MVEAVNCAVEIQTELKARNASIPPERRMEFRIEVILGDVMVEGEQIYGDGVNVAARLEGLADPGGLCISGTAHDQVRDKLALTNSPYDPGCAEERSTERAYPVPLPRLHAKPARKVPSAPPTEYVTHEDRLLNRDVLLQGREKEWFPKERK